MLLLWKAKVGLQLHILELLVLTLPVLFARLLQEKHLPFASIIELLAHKQAFTLCVQIKVGLQMHTL